MTSIFVQNEILYLDFQFKGKRCRERTGLPDSEFNRRKLEKFCKRMDAQIMRILIYVNTDSGQYEHPAFPALGSVLF